MQLFELEDQSWLPVSIRNGVTDFLQFAAVRANLYGPFAPRLASALTKADSDCIVDLGSGGGGPWLRLRDDLTRLTGREVSVTLTDYFPNTAAFKRIAEADSGGRMRYIEVSISALNVPQDLRGLRTMFSAFHHFDPSKAQAILADAIKQRQGIVIAESTQRHPLLIAYMLLTPILVLLTSPFQKPFRWSRLFWTYVVPLVPLVVMFDGIVSCLRTYTPAELMSLVHRSPGHESFTWECGVERLRPLPVGVTYLIGLPREQAAD